MTGGPLVLVEPYANRLGGHHHRTMVALAKARPGSLVIAPHGIATETARALCTAGARLAIGRAGHRAGFLLAAARLVSGISAAGQRLLGSRRWPVRLPHQVTLLARCLAEASALRTACRLEPDADAVVILTASEALHGAVALLGGQPHLRFVHECVTTEDTAVRLLGRLARRGVARVIAVYPTQAVADEFAEGFPDLPAVVGGFAVDDARRLTAAERECGRAAFDVPGVEAVVCLVGGWWPYKDIDVIDAALERLKEPLHLVVAGGPLDEDVLQRWRALPDLRVHVVPGPVGESVLRLVYGAADATLVTRRPGTGRESGLVMDAVIRQPPPLPGPDAPGLLGMRSAEGQAEFLTRTFAALRTKES